MNQAHRQYADLSPPPIPRAPGVGPDTRFPPGAVAVRSPQGGGEASMLTRVAATVWITVVRCPRVPPVGCTAEGHSVPHTCAWMGWVWATRSPETSTPTRGRTVPETDSGGQAEHARTQGEPLRRNSANYLPTLGRRSVLPPRSSPHGDGVGWGDGTPLGIAPVYQKHRARQTHLGGRIGPEACPVPAGEGVPPGAPKPRSTTAVTLTVLR